MKGIQKIASVLVFSLALSLSVSNTYAEVAMGSEAVAQEYTLATDDSSSYFNSVTAPKTVDGYTYYISQTQDSNLYRMKTDGTGKQRLVAGRVQEFVIIGNTINYNNYSQGGYLYSINLDGTNNVQLNTEHSIYLKAQDGVLSYQINNGGITNSVVIDPIEDNPPIVVTPPVVVTPPIVSTDAPSSWAVNGINKAKELGIVSDALLSKYQSNITREEFCELVVKVYEGVEGKSAELPSVNKFKDTTNVNVLKANALGIVLGVSADQFNPKDNVTREQIAVMIDKLLGALNINPILTEEYVSFADESKISDWAKGSVQKVYKLGIMSGIGEQKIDPLGNTTREQAIILAFNFFELYKIKTVDQPSSWAVDGVNKAKELGIVSDVLLSKYQNNITREEFCELIVRVYEGVSGKPAELPITNKFKDTTNVNVLKANVLGIVLGVSEDQFNPKDNVTREQIAVMIDKLLVALDINPILTAEYISFADESQIHDWAKGSVQTVYKLGIMSGIGEQKIDPLGNTTREQAIVLTSNFFEIFKSK